MPEPEVNKKYRHYKGEIYKITDNNLKIQRFTEHKRGK